MLCHIRHLHTEAAFALVNDEAAGLEYSCDSLVLGIEVIESNEVTQKSRKVAVYMKELVHHIDVCSFFSKG